MDAMLTEVRASSQPCERIAYSVHEAAAMLGVHYFSVYWLIRREKLRACRALPAKILIPRSELLRLLNTK
ncbi:MAG: helix-turn-helix domain-containing protein [Verrucomicrobiota bacterium]|nr:helix-turn-helix domain-containing protein [Verrucomicrobiota bacterium]